MQFRFVLKGRGHYGKRRNFKILPFSQVLTTFSKPFVFKTLKLEIMW